MKLNGRDLRWRGQLRGGSCRASSDCSSNVCSAEGVCCSVACNGACQSCALASRVGTCSNIVAGGHTEGQHRVRRWSDLRQHRKVRRQRRLPADRGGHGLRQRNLRGTYRRNREWQPGLPVSRSGSGADVRRQRKLRGRKSALVRRLPVQHRHLTVQALVYKHHGRLQRPDPDDGEQCGWQQLHRQRLPEAAERRDLRRGLRLHERTLCRRGLLRYLQLRCLHGLRLGEHLGQDRRRLPGRGRGRCRAARPVRGDREQLVRNRRKVRRVGHLPDVVRHDLHAWPKSLCGCDPRGRRNGSMQRYRRLHPGRVGGL